MDKRNATTGLATGLVVAAMAMSGAAGLGIVLAQERFPAATIKSSPAPRSQFLYRTSTIVGTDVHDPKDNKIGDIKDLILGSSRGDIAYAVVAFGGVMGVGTKYHPIPWKALQPSDDGKYYVLHADRETISQAPGFDRGKWPDLTERSWSEEVDRYWSRRVGQGMADRNRLPPERASGMSRGGTAENSGQQGREQEK